MALADSTTAGPQATGIERRGDTRGPLSCAQERLWFVSRLEGAATRYNETFWLRRSTRVLAGLESVVQGLVARHATLRTTVQMEQEALVQRVGPPAPVRLAYLDVRGVAADARQVYAAVARAHHNRPLDLSTDRPLRIAVVHESPTQCRVLLTVHHIACDGQSVEVMAAELDSGSAAARAGLPALWPPLAIDYLDFARWQRAEAPSDAAAVAYWTRQLAGAPTVALPFRRSTAETRGGWAKRVPLRLPGELVASLRGLARQEAATVFMAALAAHVSLLHCYTGETDVVVGVPIHGRTHPETVGVVGFFVNLLPVRVDMRGRPTGRQVLRRVRTAVLGALAHQDVPFERVVEALRPVRTGDTQPWFTSTLQLYAAGSGRRGAEWPEVTASESKMEWRVDLLQDGDALTGYVEYPEPDFDPAGMRRVAGHYERMLEAVCTSPDQPVASVALAGRPERHLTRVEWSTGAERGRAAVVEAIRTHMTERPDAVAVIDGEGAVSYGELQRRTAGIAAALRQAGVTTETRVALMMERSARTVAAMLGVWEAGGAWLPLDPLHPAARREAQLSAARVQVMLCTGPPADAGGRRLLRVTELAPQRRRRTTPPPDPARLAYVLFTSGTTGTPKAVEVPHGALGNLVAWQRGAFDVTESARATQMASSTYDASVFEVWAYLAAGGTVHIVDDHARLRPARLVDELVAEQITHAFIPSPLLSGVVESLPPGPLALRYLLTGGEQLTWRPRSIGPCLMNCYGPTENGVVSTAAAVRGEAQPPIGRPIPNTTAWVLTDAGELAPIGIAGELYVGGVSLARGYDDPALTAVRFIPSPFGPGERLYRTGDLARWRADGVLEFLGRRDRQVKVRGVRIEPGEIEARLAEHPAVAQVAVVARPAVEGGAPDLVAYLVLRDGHVEQPAAVWRALLRTRLPEIMIPRTFMRLPVLPVTSHGKVNQAALPAPPAAVEAGPGATFADETERWLAAVFADVLGCTVPGPTSNFFDLGGHSLLLPAIADRIVAQSGVRLSVSEFFKRQTVADLAEAIRTSAPASGIVPRGERRGPLSCAQERLWFVSRLEGAGTRYNETFWLWKPTWVLAGLASVVQGLVARHAVLRTTLRMEQGAAVQEVGPPAPMRLAYVDVRGVAADVQENVCNAVARAHHRPRFDLTTDRPLRVAVVQESVTQCRVLLTLHHIACDARSIEVLATELTSGSTAARAGAPAPWPPLAIEYLDFARWQRRASGSAETLAYWTRQLAGARTVTLPFRQAGTGARTTRTERVPLRPPTELVASLGAVARQEAATVFMAALAAYVSLLHRYTGETDVVVGVPTHGRTQPETIGVVGFFVNLLAVRVDLGGQPTLRQVLQRVRESVLGALAHQEVPFERVVEAVRPLRTGDSQPWFTSTLQVYALSNRRHAWTERAEVAASEAKVEWRVDLVADGDALTGFVEYAVAEFEPAAMRRVARHYERMLAALGTTPDAAVATVPLTSGAERHQTEVEWPASVEGGSAPVQALIRDQMARRPDAIAVTDSDGAITYGELRRRSAGIAEVLRQAGITPEARVGLAMERSARTVAAMLGVWEAGGAWLPLDPLHPAARRAAQLIGSGVRVVLTSGPATDVAPECQEVRVTDVAPQRRCRRTSPVDLQRLAYVVYTSGTTGLPNAVDVSHAALGNLVAWEQDALAMTSDDRMGQVAAITFDAASLEIWPALSTGASLHFTSDEVRLVPERYAEWLLTHDVTLAFTPTALLPGVVRAVEARTSPGRSPLRVMMTGGELLSWSSPPRRQVAVLNCYGPTENAVVSTSRLAGDEARPPIGRPITNTSAWILTSAGEPAPMGIVGELCVGGASLARGYDDPALTAVRFVPSPFGQGARLYRTGDLARWRWDGTLEFLGRRDGQVKIRGVRIELGEIEGALTDHPSVAQAAVAARPRPDGGVPELVAYLVLRDGEPDLAAPAWRAFLRTRLPEVMIPCIFMRLPALPVTSHGKVNRTALPAPSAVLAEEPQGKVGDETEQRLADIWAAALGRGVPGATYNFFDLGGHSLLLPSIADRIATSFGVKLPLYELFRYPTIRDLAVRINLGAASKDAEAARAVSTIRSRAERQRAVLAGGARRGSHG